MCGIAGFIDYDKRTNPEALEAMTHVLQHRGPDDSGTTIRSGKDWTLGMGHRRLSIIDLTKQGRQPMQFKELTVVFNGEIYNFKEIRNDLITNYGCRFDTQTDTEVILQSFYQWGIRCVEKFIGMFAIGLYDGRDRKFYLIRDRAGVKPLFYYEKEGLFLFGSELKSFHKHPEFKKEIDLKALGFYLQYGYVGTPYSIFKNTRKVLPGCYLVYDLNKRELKREKYWDVYDSYNQPKLKIDYQEAKSELKSLFHSAFNYRMVSDVPVGVFLSGGYDSSLVTSILQANSTKKIKTFTIGFQEEQINESEYAKKVAAYLGTEHREYVCTEQDALEGIPGLPIYYDEPFGDPSSLPTMLVCRKAREEVTVALSADGGDETFAGYQKHENMLRNLGQIQRIPGRLQKPAGKMMRFLQGTQETNYKQRKRAMLADILRTGADGVTYNSRSLKRISDSRLLHLTGAPIYEDTALNPPPELKGVNGALEEVLAVDYQTYLLDDILVKVDRAAMSVSLEGREPLLDHRIIEFAARLPTNYKYHQGVKKRILRDITHEYLPRKLMDRPKMGFGIPLSFWLRGVLKERVNYYLGENFLTRQGIFKSTLVQEIKKNFYKGEEVDSEFIWFMLMFQMWYEKWME